MNTATMQEQGQATAKQAWLAFESQRPLLALDDETATFVVQGFRGAGLAFAQIAHRHGLKVVAVADWLDGIYNPEGLPLIDLLEHVEQTGTLAGFWAGREIAQGELLALECGVLVIGEAAGMTPEEALRVRAKGVLELATDVLSSEAAEVLHSRSITVIQQ